MAPVGEHGDQVFCNPPFGQKYPEDLMREDRLQLLKARQGATRKIPPVKTSVRHQDIAAGIECKEIAKGLDGDDGTGDGIPGTVSRRKSFRESQAQRLRSERSSRS